LLQDKRILYVQVFGAKHPMNSVIIQPVHPSVMTSELLTQIQPSIDYAHEILLQHFRLLPELITVATPDRPVATTDKGTVKSKETLERFEQEIESAY
jgi:hypothetical protein